MAYKTIIDRTEDYICFLSFNRPQRLNAVTLELYGELREAIRKAEQDSTIRVIVLSGEGRAFCVGADLKEHGTANRTENQKRAYAQAEQIVCETIQKSAKPFVAAVNGYALGAGAEMALSCDLVVMRETAEMGFPEISIGTYLGGGLTYVLPRLVGMSKAKELIFLGRRITGTEAARIGLVYKASPDELFDQDIRAVAEELATKAPISLAIAKKHLLEHHTASIRTALDHEAEALLQCMNTEDWAEGVRAFAEKRKPVFKGT